MEISDYLRVFRRRLWILILLPVLAGGAVAAFLLLQPTTYSATATVAAPALVGGSQTNQYSGANGTKTFVSNYQAAITSPAIVNAVAKETGASTADITNGLVVAPINPTSSLLHVTYTTTHHALAVPVAQAAASKTLTFLFQTQADLTQQTLDQAQQALAAANTSLSSFEKSHGVLLDQVYQAQVQSLNTLKQSQISQQAQGNTGAAAVISAQVRAAQIRLAQLGPLVADYQKLTAARDQAQTRVDGAEQSAQQANAQLSAADPARTVSVTGGTAASTTSTLVKGVVVAAGAALFIAVLLVLLLELLRRPTRSETAGAPQQREAVATGR